MLARVATVLLLAVASAALADDGADVRRDYILKCSGCHNMDGSGHPDKGIPDFRDQVGYFLLLPEGRAFLMQVAGLINSGLSDARAAAVTNYLVVRFAGTSLPPDFQPYNAAEARAYREARPADLPAKRNALYQQITAAGHPLN